jgi:hypothetical protein
MGLLDLILRRKAISGKAKDTDQVPVRGYFEIVHQRGGKELSRQKVDNTVLYVGKHLVASRLVGLNSLNALNYMGLGSDSTAAAVGQSLLLAELTGANASGAARVQCSTSTVNVSAPSGLVDTCQFYYSYAIQVSCQIQEVAIFNLSGANNGQAMGRQVVTAINAQSGDTVQVTYKFQF